MSQNDAAESPQLSIAQWLELLSPSGQQKIIDFVAEARRVRGANWLPEIKAEFPLASWVVELVCTRTADQAVDDIAAAFPNLPIRLLAGEKIKTLHARLLAEVDKKR